MLFYITYVLWSYQNKKLNVECFLFLTFSANGLSPHEEKDFTKASESADEEEEPEKVKPVEARVDESKLTDWLVEWVTETIH